MSPRSKRNLRALSAASLACAAIGARDARAEPAVMIGGFVGFAVGPHAGFVWGFDARGWVDIRRRDEPAFGPFARLTFRKVASMDFAFGTNAIGRAEKELHLGADLGISWRLKGGEPADFGAFHFGGNALIGSPTSAAVTLLGQARVPWGGAAVDGAAGGGLWLHPAAPLVLDGGGCGGYGRPLRIADHVMRPRLLTFEGVGRGQPDPTEMALARAWRDDTSSECGSVPAFLKLAEDLAALGAPMGLVARARRAAEEELVHTRICAALAESYDGVAVVAPILLPSRRPSENMASALTRLALESWKDGCLGEGQAAARARHALARTTVSRVGRALAVIARDEQGHADLGWSILEWVLGAGGATVREAFREEMKSEPAVAVFDDELDAQGGADDLDVWAAHGRLATTNMRQIRMRTYESAERRARRLLDATY